MTKTIFITGAGSGIGAATARLFHQKGWGIGAYDIDTASVKTLASDLGARCFSGHIDVTDNTSVKAAMAAFAKETGGRMDVMCNNAGTFDDLPFVQQSWASIERILRVNTEGPLNCAQAAFPMLRDTKDAKLVNIASAAAIYGIPNEMVYSASKFFVRGMSEALQLEWRADDIGVAVIMPSYVTTPMLTNAEHISWKEKFGVKLTAQDVASTIWKATNSNRLYWPLPGSTRFLMFMIRAMPLALIPWLTRKIFYG